MVRFSNKRVKNTKIYKSLTKNTKIYKSLTKHVLPVRRSRNILEHPDQHPFGTHVRVYVSVYVCDVCS